MLFPRIKADEPFTMTLEQNGYSYTFEGRLIGTEITLERDIEEVNNELGWRTYIPRLQEYKINLDISARNMVRNVQ